MTHDPMKDQYLYSVDPYEPEVVKWDVRWTILAILLIDAGLIWWLLDMLGVV